MKKYIFSVLIALLSLPVIAQQQQSQAKSILDKTAEAFRKAGGVKADFTVKVITDGLIEGVEHGTIQLKGEKFVLKTTDIVTWFDGKTQWSYVAKNDEVNVSNPTQEELQQINPYTFLYMYQKGFSYKLGTMKTFRGKAIWEVDGQRQGTGFGTHYSLCDERGIRAFIYIASATCASDT